MKTMSKPVIYEVPTWEQIYEMLIELANRVRKSEFKPDVLLGISRGGWPPARVVSDLLENPNIANMKIEFYVDIGRTSKRPVITQPISVNVHKKKVLIIDDVADTGRSLEVARRHLTRKGASQIKIATIYCKPHSIVKPDYYMKETSAWVIFPWERFEATKLLVQRAKKNGKPLSLVVDELKKGGLDEKIVKRFVEIITGES